MCVEIIRKCNRCYFSKHFYWSNCRDFTARLEDACSKGKTPPKQEDCPRTLEHKGKSQYRALNPFECQNKQCPWEEWRTAENPDDEMYRVLREQREAEMERLLQEKEAKDKEEFAEKWFKKVPIQPQPTWEKEGSPARSEKTPVEEVKK